MAAIDNIPMACTTTVTLLIFTYSQTGMEEYAWIHWCLLILLTDNSYCSMECLIGHYFIIFHIHCLGIIPLTRTVGKRGLILAVDHSSLMVWNTLLHHWGVFFGKIHTKNILVLIKNLSIDSTKKKIYS
jgi:hypothetical protein